VRPWLRALHSDNIPNWHDEIDIELLARNPVLNNDYAVMQTDQRCSL